MKEKNKKIILLILVILLSIITFTGLLLYRNYSNNQRYETIKKDIMSDVTEYIKNKSMVCRLNYKEIIITEEDLINTAKMDKDKLLDIDKESYCKVRIKLWCLDEAKWAWNTYLSCKDHEDEEFKEYSELDEEKIEFNEKEKKIIDTIYNKLDVYQYFDKDNLESFEIISLQNFGYYESESNILYVTIYYNSICKDGTYKCDRLGSYKEKSVSNDVPFSFLIKIDINNYDYIEKINGFATHINSDWINTSGRIE